MTSISVLHQDLSPMVKTWREEPICDTTERCSESPLFTDLRGFISNQIEPELPDVGPVESGQFLFYSGRINEIHGEPGVGKTNINLAVAAKELERGNTVLFIDPEDSPAAIVRRLRSFGADANAILKQFHYLHNPEPGDILAAAEWARENPVHLCVIDGLAELLAAQGLSEDKPADILPFFREFIRPFSDAGAAVVISDHVTKNPETRGSWSRGSGAKMGRYDGASYELKLLEAYSPNKAGAVGFIVAKDRNGGVGPKRSHVVNIRFTPGGDSTRVAFCQPDGNGFKPTILMKKIYDRIKADPEVNQRGLREMSGKAFRIDQAIQLLSEEGVIEVQKNGPGKPNRFKILKPYPDDAQQRD